MVTLELLEAECFRKSELFRRYTAVLDALGLFGADQFLHIHLVALVERLISNLQLEQRRQDFGFISLVAPQLEEMEESETDHDKLKLSLQKIESILGDFARQCAPNFKELLDLVSPKFRSLLDILREKWTISMGSFQGIIFVAQRHVATSLCWMLKQLPEYSSWLRPAALMGHGEDLVSNSVGGMSVKEQNLIRQQFKDKVFNLRWLFLL